MMNTDILITIGSRAFFEGMEGFHPKDTDLLILQAKPSGYRYVKQIHMSGRCIYYWRGWNISTMHCKKVQRCKLVSSSCLSSQELLEFQSLTSRGFIH